MPLAVVAKNISSLIIVRSAGAMTNVFLFIMARAAHFNGILFQSLSTIRIISKRAIKIGNIMVMAAIVAFAFIETDELR